MNAKGRGWLFLSILAGLLFSWLYFSLATSELSHLSSDSVAILSRANHLALHGQYATDEGRGTILETYNPFLFPLVLAAFQKVGGISLLLMHRVTAATASLSFLFLFLFGRHLAQRERAFLLLLTVATPFLVSFSRAILSDYLFSALVFAGLWLKERDRAAPVLLGLTVAACYLTRSLGLALLLAIGCDYLFAQGGLRKIPWRDLLRFIIAATVPGVLWLGRNIWVGQRDRLTPLDLFLTRDPAHTGGAMGLLDFIPRIFHGFVHYAILLKHAWFSFYLPALPSFVVILLTAAFTLLIGAGMVRNVRERRIAGPLFFGFYLGVLLLWHSNEYRYLLPLIPLTYYFALQGAEWLLKFPWRRQKWTQMALVILFAMVFFGNLFKTLFLTIRHYRAPPEFNFSLFTNASQKADAHWESWHDSFLWLESATYWEESRKWGHLVWVAEMLKTMASPDDLVATHPAQVFRYFSGLPTLKPPPFSSVEHVQAWLEAREVNFVVTDEIYPESRGLASLLRQMSDQVEKISNRDLGATELWHVR